MRLSPLHVCSSCVGGFCSVSVPQEPSAAAQDPVRGVSTFRSVREYAALVLPCGSQAEVLPVGETLTKGGG